MKNFINIPLLLTLSVCAPLHPEPTWSGSGNISRDLAECKTIAAAAPVDKSERRIVRYCMEGKGYSAEG